MSRPEKDLHVDALARYLPKGRLFEGAFIADSNLRGFLCGLAGELMDAQNYITELEYEYFPNRGTRFIEEWEQALGLPDKCLGRGDTIEERRRDILLKLAASGVQTVDDFVRLGEIFGIELSISNGANHSSFCTSFPHLFVNNPADARYLIVVQLPPEGSDGFCYDFCAIFGDVTQNALKCLLEELKPANTRLVYPVCN